MARNGFQISDLQNVDGEWVHSLRQGNLRED